MNRHQVKLESQRIGDDILVVLTGGEKPHCGAIAVALPSKITSCSVISIPEHKDGDIAKPLAEKIAKKTGKKVVLVAGIHVDNATPDDIRILIANSEKEVDKFLEVVR